LFLLAGVAACGRSENTNALLAGNAAATDAMANSMMADSSNRFARIEVQMNEKMMTAVGANAGDNWVRKMIEHHQGAVDMSRIVLEQNPSADAARMTRDTIDKQSKEIGDLRRLVQSGTPDPQSARLYEPGMATMHDAMMAAKGSNVSETYLRKMLAHHKGAVAMSDIALQNGATGAVKAQVQKTRSDQLKESQMVEGMLRGESKARSSPSQQPMGNMNMSDNMTGMDMNGMNRR